MHLKQLPEDTMFGSPTIMQTMDDLQTTYSCKTYAHRVRLYPFAESMLTFKMGKWRK